MGAKKEDRSGIVSLEEGARRRMEGGGEERKQQALLLRDLTRYEAALRWVWPSLAGLFSPDETVLLCDALRNARYDPNRFDRWPSFLAWDLEDVEKYEKLGRDQGIDVPFLSEKLEKMTPLQALVLIDRIEAYWAERDRGLPEEEALSRVFGAAWTAP